MGAQAKLLDMLHFVANTRNVPPGVVGDQCLRTKLVRKARDGWYDLTPRGRAMLAADAAERDVNALPHVTKRS